MLSQLIAHGVTDLLTTCTISANLVGTVTLTVKCDTAHGIQRKTGPVEAEPVG
jgi:hypothetical protein